MAILVLGSASGAPGATTTAVGLALAWPRPVIIVEADTCGASPILSGYCRGTIHHDRGVIDLAIAHRTGGAIFDHLPAVSIDLPGSEVRLVPGLAKAAQSAAMAEVWEPLAGALRRLHASGTDAIIDVGRLHTESTPLPLLLAADLLLLVTRTRLPDVAASRSRAAVLSSALRDAGAPPDTLQLLLVGENRPYGRREVVSAVGAPVAAAVPWDPEGAAVYSDGAAPARRPGPLARSMRAGAAALSEWMLGQPANTGAQVAS